LGGIAKASGLDDGVPVQGQVPYRGSVPIRGRAIVKGKALGDATRAVGEMVRDTHPTVEASFRNRELNVLTRREFMAARERAVLAIREAGIPITEREAGHVEMADFGLSRLDREGAQILTLVATDRMAAKIIVLFPGQTLPEHWHPPVGADPGKEETVRVVRGVLRCYVPGADDMREGFIPEGKQEVYTVRHEVLLEPGGQITLAPGTKHWFQAGPEGVVAYSFSTVARDVLDGFTDPQIERVTRIADREQWQT